MHSPSNYICTCVYVCACVRACVCVCVSFMGQTLANHSYVDLSTVESEPDGSDSVQCHTDLSPCCSGRQGPHRGD